VLLLKSIVSGEENSPAICAMMTNTEINIVIGVCTNRELICMALTLINNASLFDLV
jgi:hypothetical protein